MRKLLRSMTAGAALLAVSLTAFASLEPAPPALKMTAQDPSISRTVARLIEELHYSQPKIDNSYSSAFLDQYLDALDGNRMYFLQSDIANFNQYRYQLDDRVKSGQLQPIFDIFNVYRERTRQRAEYALSMLQKPMDFTVDERFVFDRTKLPWAGSEQALNEIWRKKVKSDALSLMLAGKTWPEAVEALTKRYETQYKRMTQITATDVFETFMNSVAETFDPHSSYLSPHQSEEYRIQMSLSYDGIGASLQQDNDFVKVVKVIPGGPAQLSGKLKPKDRITAIGQGAHGKLVDIIGWRLDDVVQLIRGPGGTTVRLQILPAGAAPGSPQEVISLVRQEVKLEDREAKSKIKTITYEGHPYKIGVIHVPSFYQDFAARMRGDKNYTSTSRDVTRLIHKLQGQGIDGLVMDLRENGGGHLSEAIALAGLFIHEGPIVQLRESRGRPEVLDDPNPGIVYSGPMAVLVDRYSASASEIFAGAIQDYQRGPIVGQQTFGKGTVQNLFNLDRIMRHKNEGQLTLTIGKFYRITGASTQHRGVIPDIKLPSLIDKDTIGESTHPTALPWDTIAPTKFTAFQNLQPEIGVLQAREKKRLATNPDLAYLAADVAEVKQIRAENKQGISLNLATRKADQKRIEDKHLALENQRRAADGQKPLASTKDLDKAEAPDEILLDEASRIVAEMVVDGGAAKRPQLLTGVADAGEEDAASEAAHQ